MKLEFSSSFEKKAKKLFKKNPQLHKNFIKQFRLFNTNSNHPSLKLHKLQGKRSQQYSVWIKKDLRAIAIKKSSKYIFYDLVTHDKY